MVWTLQLASPQTEAMRGRQHVNADSAISRNRLGAIAISFRDKEADDPVREREYERYRGDIPMFAGSRHKIDGCAKENVSTARQATSHQG